MAVQAVCDALPSSVSNVSLREIQYTVTASMVMMFQPPSQGLAMENRTVDSQNKLVTDTMAAVAGLPPGEMIHYAVNLCQQPAVKATCRA